MSDINEKIKIDLMSGFDVKEIEKTIEEKFFPKESIKTKKVFDAMQLGLQLLSKPKKLKIILIVIGSLSVIGLISINAALIYLVAKLIMLF